MLTISYSEYNLIFFFFFCLVNIWSFFFFLNFFNLKIKNSKADLIVSNNIIKNFYFMNIIYWFIILFFFMFLYVYLFRGISSYFWWSHLKLNNFNFYFFYFFFILGFILLFLIFNLKNNKEIYSIDYLFSIINLLIFLPLFFFTSNFFTFFFLLEAVSCLIFYKFVGSKIWYKQNFKIQNSTSFFFSKKYLNVLFFQYWANFFSSTTLLFIIINFVYFFGTTDWVLLNNLFLINFEINYFLFYNIFWLLGVVFIFSLFVKIGFTPVHLFKIEIYKGVPFISIFFYTTFYFLIFFFYFIFIFFYYLNNFFLYFWYFFFIFFCFGIFYIISLLFDINYIKAFFAYSTILNAIGFIGVALAI